jgi:hypothetical protein
MMVNPCTWQLLPVVGYTVRMKPRPIFPAGKPLFVDHHEIFDSCLVLATNLTAKKNQSRKNFTLTKRPKVLKETLYRKSINGGVIPKM